MIVWLESLSGWFVGGASAGGGFVALRWMLEKIWGRMDKREAAIDAGTQRLIDALRIELDRMSARVDRLQEGLDECKQKHAESEAEVMRLKAIMQGYGDVRQGAQVLAAVESLKEARHG